MRPDGISGGWLPVPTKERALSVSMATVKSGMMMIISVGRPMVPITIQLLPHTLSSVSSGFVA